MEAAVPKARATRSHRPRLDVLFRHVATAQAKSGALTALATRSAHEKSFLKGLLAHLLLVPGWVISPMMLLGGLVAAGAPQGAKGVVATLGLGAGLATGPSNAIRVLICAAIAAVAAAGKRGRALAGTGAGIVSLLCWMVSCNSFPRNQWLFDFVSRWAPDFYAQAELRGALSNVQRGRSFFAFHPHGCLCAGFTINGTFNPDFMRAAGKVSWLCDPALRYRNPGFRLMADSYEGEDRSIEGCDSANFRAHMSKGDSVAFVPGGFLDAVAFKFQRECCVLSDRKAFVKLCLQFGYRVHPVYTFGESDTYRTFTGFRNLRVSIARKNVPMVAFAGWAPMPFLPRPEARILTYVGEAIEFPAIEAPTREDVDHWHGIYVSKLRELFDKHKAEAGRPEAELEIL